MIPPYPLDVAADGPARATAGTSCSVRLSAGLCCVGGVIELAEVIDHLLTLGFHESEPALAGAAHVAL
jgi:hypothetical protein